MRDPQRIADVLSELSRTWEAQPDVTLAHVWAQLEARGVALNSSDAEVVEALRAVQRDFPLSLSFPDVTSAQPACALIETEGPVRRVSLNFIEDEAWIVVRTPRSSAHPKVRGRSSSVAEDPQPGVWQISELVKCQAGLPLQAKDLDGITHRLGVIRQIRAMASPLARPFSGARQSDWSGEKYLIQVEDAVSIVLGHNVRMWEQEQREVRSATFHWRTIHQCDVGKPFEFTDASGTRQRFGDISRVLRVD